MNEDDLLIDLKIPFWQASSRRRSLHMPSSEQLALEAQRGNRESMQELVVRHHALLFGFLFRLTGGDRPLAEDLTQEAFVHLIRSLAGYGYPRPFKPWLYAIAVNCARDYYKRADTRRSSVLSGEALEARLESHVQYLPEESIIARTEVDRVSAAIQELPLPQREALILRYCQDLSLAEIAESLGIPVGTVKSRLSIGLHRLKERLAEEITDGR